MSTTTAPTAQSARRPRRRSGSRPPSTQRTTSARPRPSIEAAECDPTPVEFSTLDFDPRIAQGVADRGFTRTTPVQSATIPAVRLGGDLIGCAETGTGKTAAFLLPLMERLLKAPGPRTSTRVLVLAPTRELAVQIADDFEGFAYHTDLSVAAVYGGVGMYPQQKALEAAVDVVVATPGRLLDHLSSRTCRFDGLEVLVLDEADRLLDMGFWPDVRRIVSALPLERQTLFFSATMSDDVFRSALEIMRDPRLVKVGTTGGLPPTITHRAQRVARSEKPEWLARFLRRTDESAIVFVRTKRGADRLARRLQTAGIRCTALHADRTQAQRTAAVEGFRSGRFTTLVATDIAARGLDIEGVGHVINFEVPDTPDAYVHRVGRTGRAEVAGTALTLIAVEELETVRFLEKSLKISLADPRADEAKARPAAEAPPAASA